ncbi:sialidase [Chloropicon primus]|uniref:Sialidase n=1 Tax=Chloropicon primus TaxID=1764295 RepID=A0A5B8MTK6_9CHLO|nr:sialidase [Chloropicon primus]UPR02298.1 sialidase [Chloropicon primus]|eukprot:QDZ23084.1 sialidase [Chloropicon primus]
MRRGVVSPPPKDLESTPHKRSGSRGGVKDRTSSRNKGQLSWLFPHSGILCYLVKVVLASVCLVAALGTALAFSYEARKDKYLLYSQADVSYSFVHLSYVKPSNGPEKDAEDAAEKKEIEADGYQFYKRLNARGDSRVSRLRYMHMGMLEQLPNGSVAAFFQSSESRFEGVFDQSIYWSVSDDHGATWNHPQTLISSNRKLPIWSPVAHRSEDRIFLFYSKSTKFCEYFDKSKGVMRHSPGGDVFFVSSDNNGSSWTFPQKLLAYEEQEPATTGAGAGESKVSESSEGEGSGGLLEDKANSRSGQPYGVPKVIANKLTVLSNGAWLLPYWREPGRTCPVIRSGLPRSQWVNGSASVVYTENQGLSWHTSGEVSNKDTWLIESSIAEVQKHGVLLQMFRTKAGQAYRGYSRDMGRTWTDPVRTYLPNPNSKMCILELPNGNVLATYNHSSMKRTPLSLAVSKDGGVFWTTVAHLETDPELQFAYPTMQIVGDDLFVIYSVMSKQSGVLESVGMKTAKLSVQRLLKY